MDAGTNSANHYADRMSPWRFRLRQMLLNIVRNETPILAFIQQTSRSRILDTYFAMSANIGTHTFYMVMLPLFFWCGMQDLGLDVVWVLAIGVFGTGYIKDLLCLPRPRSPPLHRISMSGSAKLEYGMPSTHSCNAVSVVMVLNKFTPHNAVVKCVSIWLLTTLITGRIYTGMHGFLDVCVGCLCGVLSFKVRQFIKNNLDPTNLWHNLIITLGYITIITLYAEPVDDCPCFDDSLAFSGVILGAIWSVFLKPESMIPQYDVNFSPMKSKFPFIFWILRFFVGVSLILSWRYSSKRILLRVLPPIWRLLDKMGLKNPRRYFVPASQYTKIKPENVVDLSITESSQDIKEMIHNLGHPPQDVVGPQSDADFYELKSPSYKVENESMNTAVRSALVHPHIIEPRKHYDIEVVMRLIVYGGIGFIALIAAPECFQLLYL